MIIKGKYNEAKVFVDELEEGASSQIKELLDQEFVADSKVRIMPDVHPGMGCVIGFTADMGDKVIPNIVGVDIGCGMLTIKLGDRDIDFEKLDRIIDNNIPSGFNVHQGRQVKFDKLQDLHCYRELTGTRRMERSIGTLGGGNHFIEVGEDSQGTKYLVIHSGSRNLGKQVADFYQKMAIDLCSGMEGYYVKKEEIIKKYREDGRTGQIEGALKKLKKNYEKTEPDYPRQLCYLTGKYRENYLHDMKICQEYASLNRLTMADIILEKLWGQSVQDFQYFETIHNYIDFRDNVIRKGAISANKDELILIPINMRDGSILARGRGNEDWNNSAPHGAGRVMSRNEARQSLSLDKFKEEMKDVWTTSVNKKTLDENPAAYKSMDEILKNLDETAELIDIIKPLYNYKSS